MHKLPMPKLQATRNYDQFELSSFNRKLHNIEPLRESMKKHGFLPAYPIHCVRGENGKLVIKAGHHRFVVARELGIELFYVVSNDTASIVDLENSSKAWSMSDYLHSYALQGSESHILVSEFSQRYGVSISQSASLLAGESASSHNAARKMKTSAFNAFSNDRAEKVGYVVLELTKMGIRHARSLNSVSAICSVCWLEEFDADKFLRKVQNNVGAYTKCSTLVQYQEVIERIYNHGSVNRIALAFHAREAAKKRSAVTRYE